MSALFETARFAETLGVVRLEEWPEGVVLWQGGEIVWRSWEAEAAKLGPRAASTWVNFYAKGNSSNHFTREFADLFAAELKTNPRIACIEVSAQIGEGL